MFPTNDSYIRSVQGLHQLHMLAHLGKDDDPEADDLRASLELPWRHLTETDKMRITGLSEDLYSLSEPPSPPLAMTSEAQKRLVEALEARQGGEWDKALELLRRWGRYLDPALLAYLRGTIWREGGDNATAALFFRRATFLEPSNEKYAGLYRNALSKSNATDAAPSSPIASQ